MTTSQEYKIFLSLEIPGYCSHTALKYLKSTIKQLRGKVNAKRCVSWSHIRRRYTVTNLYHYSVLNFIVLNYEGGTADVCL